jgi:phosphoribosylanthranilate isomerase
MLTDVIVQVYGVTTVEDAVGVNALRPDNVGVVLDEGIDTWDSVDERTLRRVVAELSDVEVVGLSLSTDSERVRRTVATVEPSIVHLARAVNGLGVDAVARLRADLDPVQVMVTIPVRNAESVDVARRYAEVADYLLLDSVHPTTGVVGATGLTHDWSWSQQIVAVASVPVILAGGLGPDNVRDAINAVRPEGVDSETNTSRSDDRRRKDLDKVRQFIALARGAGRIEE